ELRAGVRLITDLEPFEKGTLGVDKIVRDLAVDVNAVNRAAGLTVVLVRVPPDQPRDPFGIGVSQNNRRTVAAHLPFHPRAVPITSAQDRLSDTGRTRERDEPHARMFGDA